MLPYKGSRAVVIEMYSFFYTAPSDYTPVMAELRFLPSATVLCSDISVSGDLVLEVNEVFTVQLNTSDRAILLSPSSANVTIMDDDSKMLFECCHLMAHTLYAFPSQHPYYILRCYCGDSASVLLCSRGR